MAEQTPMQRLTEIHEAVVAARNVAPLLPPWARMLYLSLLLHLRAELRAQGAEVERIAGRGVGA